jgi:galactokinase
MPSLPGEQLDRLLSEMERLFGPAKWLSAAPGRVNLIGEHVDYNDGFVLPFAIDRYTAVAARPAADESANKARVFSLDTESMQEIPVGERPRPVAGNWANYVAGVIAGYMDLGIRIPPFDAVIHSRVPVGAGLSSSAALEVAIAMLLEQATSVSLDWKTRALLCQKAEHEFANVPCGLMDQIASICARRGSALLIDCEANSVECLPLDLPGIRFFLVNSGVRHDLAESQYAIRRSECRQVLELAGYIRFRQMTAENLALVASAGEDRLFRRGRHVLTETARVLAAADCLRFGNFRRLATLMDESHTSMRDDFEISCPEIDALVEASRTFCGPMPIAARMTGGGFGGCTINLVPDGNVPGFMQAVQAAQVNGKVIAPETIEVIPADGAWAHEIS